MVIYNLVFQSWPQVWRRTAFMEGLVFLFINQLARI